MPVMFREFLVDHPLDTACFMWWDMLRPFEDAPDPDLVASISRALDEILRIPSRHCQMSALHGFVIGSVHECVGTKSTNFALFRIRALESLDGRLRAVVTQFSGRYGTPAVQQGLSRQR